MAGELLKRFGVEPESAEALAGHAALAERVLGTHGVSVTARETTAPAGTADRADFEQVSGSTTRRPVETGSIVR